MVWPLIPYSYDTVITDSSEVPGALAAERAPTGSALDHQSRDVVARILYGFRISVLFGLALTSSFSSVVGVAAGAVQGYFGGLADLAFQRLLEIWSGVPVLYVLIILSSVVEPNFWWLLAILLLFAWIGLVGLVRAEVLRARNFEYVRAARALGVATPMIIGRHVLPNAMVSTVPFLPFILGGAVTALTSLDFLGFGLPPGSPSLGELLAQGKANLQAPWLGITAFLVLAVMLSLLIFVGEAVARRRSTRASCDRRGATAPHAPRSPRSQRYLCRPRRRGPVEAVKSVSLHASTAAKRWRWSARAARASR